MHDLEARIAEWRIRQAAAIGHDRKILDELESHLREDIDALTRKGHPLETAVDMALAKLGTPETLAGEFEKNSHSWRPIYLWSGSVLLGILLAMAGYLMWGDAILSTSKLLLLILIVAAFRLCGKRARRWMVGIAPCFVVGMLVTPADPFSMLIVSVPLAIAFIFGVFTAGYFRGVAENLQAKHAG